MADKQNEPEKVKHVFLLYFWYETTLRFSVVYNEAVQSCKREQVA
jgi:hypothetical protein